MKRVLDILVSAAALIALSPLLLPVLYLIYRQDRHSPFYVAPRVGKDGRPFRMVKLRSMVAMADKTGVDSTSACDPRITPIGHFVRRYKLDEIPQLFNVIRGEMSLVGPRPNVERETRLYTELETKLLSVKPGVTDLSSIVFSDENEILKESADPDIDYNQRIRPWKSRLGLLYVDYGNVWLDLQILGLTALALVSRERALAGVERVLHGLNAEEKLSRVARRQEPLLAFPPPGSDRIVTSRA